MNAEDIPVETDETLSSTEKESWFTMTGDSKKFTAGSRKRTIVNSLMEHPYFEPSWYSVRFGSGAILTYYSDEEIPDDAEAIVAVSGKMPVGCLTVKSTPRSNNHQSSVVNSKQIDPDAFN